MTAERIDARSAHCDVSDEASLQDQAALNFLLGNWAVGRFAWVLRDIVPLDPPVPAKGAQGVWTWERDDDTNRSTT